MKYKNAAQVAVLEASLRFANPYGMVYLCKAVRRAIHGRYWHDDHDVPITVAVYAVRRARELVKQK